VIKVKEQIQRVFKENKPIIAMLHLSGHYQDEVQELAKHGIGCEGKRAVQLQKSNYDYYDYIIGMDTMNMRNIERMTGHKAGDKMRMLLEYSGDNRSVIDPWYSGKFDDTYDDLVKGCTAFLDYLREKGQI